MKDSYDTLSEALHAMEQKYSIEIFEDVVKTRSILMDWLATSEDELQRFELMARVDGMKTMLDALDGSQEDQRAALESVVQRMYRIARTAEEEARSICMDFASAIGAELPEEPPAKPAPAPETAEPPVRHPRSGSKKKQETIPQIPEFDALFPETIDPSLSFAKAEDGQRVIAYTGIGNGHVTIPSKMNGEPVVAIDSGVFNRKNVADKLITIRIPASVRRIGDAAFQGCGKLVTCQIDSGDDDLTIGQGAFAGTGLREVTLQRVRSVPERCFAGCEELHTVKLAEGVETIEREAFDQCYGLGKVILPGTLTSVEEGAFAETGLYSVEFPDGVTSIGKRAFEACTELRQVSWPKKLRTIGDQAFCGCTHLNSGSFPANLVDIGQESFCDCESLEAVEGAQSLKKLGFRAFAGCPALRRVQLPEAVMKNAKEHLVFEGSAKALHHRPNLLQRAIRKRD